MGESTTSLVRDRGEEATSPTNARAKRRRVMIATGLLVVLIAAVAVVTYNGDADDRYGMVFTIPSGSYQQVEVPGLDSAIDLPTLITFAPDDEAAITIVNEDVVEHRAGPFLVGAGQTYTQRFPDPGEYFINCSVDASESIEVIVEG